MNPYRDGDGKHGPLARLRGLGRTLRLLATDPGRYSAERYAGSSKMYLSAVRPWSWRKDLGEAAPDPLAKP